MEASSKAIVSNKSNLKNEMTHLLYPHLSTTAPLLALISSVLVYKLIGHTDTLNLTLWLAIFLTTIACQYALAIWFNKTKDSQKWDHLYFNLLLADIGLIGILWGSAGVLFMPEDTIGQSYLIFILIFVAGGGQLYLAGSYLASSIYITGVLIPLIGSLIFSFFSKPHHEVYTNIVIGLLSYWSFLLIVSYYTSKLFSVNLTNQLINEVLTLDLAEADAALEKTNITARTIREKMLLEEVSHEDLYRELNAELSHIDGLTGVDTPETLKIKYELVRAYARRHHQNFAIFVININNFLEIKNTLGDAIGNLLLKTVGIRLQYCKRETDILCRISENKFILVLSEVVMADVVSHVAKRILKLFAEKTVINGNKVQINANIGISLYPNDGDELSELIQKSEQALFHAIEKADCSFQIYDTYLKDINIKIRSSD